MTDRRAEPQRKNCHPNSKNHRLSRWDREEGAQGARGRWIRVATPFRSLVRYETVRMSDKKGEEKIDGGGGRNR